MSSPNWDILNVQHSKNIGDKVTTATDDGQVYSSAQRDGHLNQACRRWQAWMVGKALLNEAVGKDSSKQWSALAGYINEGTAALSSNVCALTGWTPTVWLVLAAYNNTTNNPVYPLEFQKERFMGSTGGLTALATSTTYQQYVLDGSQLRVIGSGATDTINLRYLAAHSNLYANGGSLAAINDDTFTAIGTAVTNFTGVLSTHVGATFVGKDNASNPFFRTIVAYVSSTAFTLSSAVAANGAGTNGYIIPLGASSDIAIAPVYWGQILDLALAVAKEEQPTQEGQALAQAKNQLALAQMGQD